MRRRALIAVSLVSVATGIVACLLVVAGGAAAPRPAAAPQIGPSRGAAAPRERPAPFSVGEIVAQRSVAARVRLSSSDDAPLSPRGFGAAARHIRAPSRATGPQPIAARFPAPLFTPAIHPKSPRSPPSAAL